MSQESAGVPGLAGQQGKAVRDVAIFAAGCFWGVQYYFDQVPEVIATVVGYTGGYKANPTYEQVCSQGTGHAEAIKINFDASKVSYETLVKHFFKIHDPTQLNRQGPDIGEQYRSAIFYLNNTQKAIAERLRDNLIRLSSSKPIVTQIVPAEEFYEAEDYHQKFTERTGRGKCHVAYGPV